MDTEKTFSTEMALLHFIEKCNSVLHRKGYVGAILVDLSKSFDKINYDVLVAKLNFYGIRKEVLKLIFNYLNNTKEDLRL